MSIVYIAPEIPGLSSTFVYNEIFMLNRNGMNILPYTIHKNIADPQTDELRELKSKTQRLYGQGLFSTVKANLICLKIFFIGYLRAMAIAVKDALGYLSRPKILLGILFRFFIAARLVADIRGKGVGHIHAHFAHFPGDIAMYASAITGIPFSITAHANDIFCNSWLLKQKAQRSAFIATISEFNKKYLANLGCDPDKIEIVRCGVIVPEIFPSPRPLSSTKKIGFIGRLVEKKGLEVLIKACDLLKQQGVVFSLEVIGSGPLEEKLKNLTNKLGLEGHIQFLGALPNSEVIPWLNRLDVFVLPCVPDVDGDMDGIPVALMEAMLYRVPVISTRLSGIPELVIDRRTGLLSEPNNIEDLARQIEMLLSQPDLHARLAHDGLDQVVSEFDATQNAMRLRSLFLRGERL